MKSLKSKRLSPYQKKMVEVMHEFKEGYLDSSNSYIIITNPKQATAGSLRDAIGLYK